LKYTHAFVGQCVNEVDTSDKQIGDANEEKIIVIDKLA
jgi:hypothetical protein